MNIFTVLGWAIILIQLVTLGIQVSPINSKNSSVYPIILCVLAVLAVGFLITGLVTFVN
jgi:predicted permease